MAKSKRPADVIGNAVHVMRVLTGEADDGPADDGKDPAAKAMGAKGGAARAAIGPRQSDGAERQLLLTARCRENGGIDAFIAAPNEGSARQGYQILRSIGFALADGKTPPFGIDCGSIFPDQCANLREKALAATTERLRRIDVGFCPDSSRQTACYFLETQSHRILAKAEQPEEGAAHIVSVVVFDTIQSNAFQPLKPEQVYLDFDPPAGG